MIHENFKNAPEWQEVTNELVGKRLRLKVCGLIVEGTAIAAYLNKDYEGKPDEHTAIVVNHEPVTWGEHTYTQDAVWIFKNTTKLTFWHEVIE